MAPRGYTYCVYISPNGKVILGGMIAVGVPLHKVLKKLKVPTPSLFCPLCMKFHTPVILINTVSIKTGARHYSKYAFTHSVVGL
jgi:hypothetical protein